MATDLITIATTAVLGQFLGPSAKYAGEQALEQGKQIAAKAVALLTAVGREPQLIEPKILPPLIQAASLETDETLVDLWAALLANAADPGAPEQVKVGFVEVLRQLDPSDTIILNMLYFSSDGKLIDEAEALEASILDTEVFDNLKDYHNIDYLKARASLDNLIRLRLCVEAEPVVRALPLASGYKRKATDFGFRFMRACTAPKAKE